MLQTTLLEPNRSKMFGATYYMQLDISGEEQQLELKLFLGSVKL